jgi:hypothetical protein
MVKLPFRVCFFFLLLKRLQWPYSYDSCDVGTLPGQVYPGTQTPLAAVENGDPQHDNILVRSYSRVYVVKSQLTAIHALSCSRCSLVSACRRVPAPASHILALRTRTAPLLAVLLPRLIFSRLSSLVNGDRCPNPPNGHRLMYVLLCKESVEYYEVLMVNLGTIRMAKHLGQFIYCGSNCNSAKYVYRRYVLPFAHSFQRP